jgi:hypothetical protein
VSVFWKKQHPPLGADGAAWGYDGDFLRGQIKVGYWTDRSEVEAEIDRQIAEIKASLLAEYAQLTGAPDAS